MTAIARGRPAHLAHEWHEHSYGTERQVAGFDAIFAFNPDDLDLLQALAGAGRRRARALSVRWRSEFHSQGRGYLRLDGNGVRLNILLERLRRDLPTIAEASRGRHHPDWRRRLANGLVDILVKSRGSWYERYNEDFVPTLRATKKPWTSSTHTLWAGDANEDMHLRLAVAEEVLTSWCLKEVRPEVVLEEIHTAAELLLTRMAGKRRAPAFAELVDHAEEAGHLSRFEGLPRFWEFWATAQYEDPCDALDHKDLLIALKDERKRSKHSGSLGAERWLDKHFWAIAALLEHLCDRAASKSVLPGAEVRPNSRFVPLDIDAPLS